MERFVARYRPLVTSILSGFDRLVFRGTLIPLIREGGMQTFLSKAGVRLLDFKGFVLSTSERIKEAALREVREAQRPVRYLESSHVDKEDLARQLDAERPVREGPICALTAVEPCTSFEYHRSRSASTAASGSPKRFSAWVSASSASITALSGSRTRSGLNACSTSSSSSTGRVH